MAKILLAIDLEYVEKIFQKEKRYEFRKVLPKKPVDCLVIYVTAPIKKVVGEVKVKKILCEPPPLIWAKTKAFSGISKTFFDQYYHNHSKAIAFELGTVIKFACLKTLSDYNIKVAPQSFVYLD